MTIREAIAEAAVQLQGEFARRDAELLLAHVLKRERAWLIAHGEDVLAPAQLDAFRSLVLRRAAHEPLQHLTGVQEFYGLQLKVTRATLIPRPETELLVEAVLQHARDMLQPAIRILDVGTGTGAIALALAHLLPLVEMFACDISTAALAVARENALRLGLASRIRFFESDLLAGVAAGESFDVVVSNPPYVALADAPSLATEVRQYEPHSALFAEEHGLAIYRRLIPEAHRALAVGGLLAMEIGFGQSEAVSSLLADTQEWKNVRVLDDYAGIPRVMLAGRAESFRLGEEPIAKGLSKRLHFSWD